MKTSKKGIDLIKKFEGFRANPYICPAGILTIGYGHTNNVRLGDFCSEMQAEQFLKEDLQIAETELNKMQDLNQNQFDALASFIFNLGVRNFQKSTLRTEILKGSNEAVIRSEFGRWVYAGGKVSKGLQARRKAEADLFFTI
jgi:lysozyme